MSGSKLNAGYVLSKEMILKASRKADLREDVSILENLCNVEVLSMSVNEITTLKNFEKCSSLRELYLRKNRIDYLYEIRYLQSLQNLRILWLSDNKCTQPSNYRRLVIRALPQLLMLDNVAITNEERAEALADQSANMHKFIQALDTDKFPHRVAPKCFGIPEFTRGVGIDMDVHPIVYKDAHTSEDELVTSISSPVDSDGSDCNGQENLNSIIPFDRMELVDFSQKANLKSRNSSILSAMLLLVEELDIDGLSQLRSRCGDLMSAKRGLQKC